MANIKPYTDAFKNAVYGEDVRDAMIGLANTLNERVIETSNIADGAITYAKLDTSVTESIGNVLLAEIFGNTVSLNGLSSFVQCAGTYQDGTINYSNKSRISNTVLINFSKSTKLTALNGFRFYLTMFNQSGVKQYSTSFVTEYDIPENYYIRIVIARVNETAQEIVNVSEFLSSITTTPFAREVYDTYKLESKLLLNTIKLTQNDVVNGFVYGNSGAFGDSSNYVRTIYINIPAHDVDSHMLVYSSLISAAGFAFYTEEKRYITGVSGNDASEKGFEVGTSLRFLEIPNNARYFICSLSTSDYSSPDSFKISFSTSTNVLINDIVLLHEDDFYYCGLKNADGSETYPSDIGTRISSRFIKAAKGDLIQSTTYFFNVFEYDSNYNFITTPATWLKIHRVQNDGYVRILGLCGSKTLFVNDIVYTSSLVKLNTVYADMPSFRNKILTELENSVSGQISPTLIPGATRALANPIVKTVGHRGYRLGVPENTLPAFAMARKVGLYSIETDVQFTSDNVPVLLHDATIDRTSNGSGTLTQMTFNQLRQYDFGSWISEDFAGTTIPTLEEALSLCRKLGLSIQLEPKQINGQFTTSQFDIIFDLIKKYNMSDYIIWTGVNDSQQRQYIMNNFEKTCMVVSSLQTINQAVIDDALEIKTSTNSVIISTDISYLTPEGVALCRENNIPLQLIFVVNDNLILNADPYAEWIMTDGVNANDVLYKDAMQVLE